MARTVKDANLDSRAARDRLKASGKPRYRSLDPGLHLGYRKGKRGGKWLARRYSGDGDYEFHPLGIADDVQDADGVSVLTFSQAQAAARKWFLECELKAAGHEDIHQGPYAVKNAITDYMADYERRSGKDTARMQAVIDAHILPALGEIEVKHLTRPKVRNWHQSLAEAPARLRTRPGKAQNVKAAPVTPDEKRKRKNTANRVLTVLKAAFNHAYHEGMAASDTAWMAVQPFQDVDSPKVRYLIDEEATRLVNACADDLRSIVIAALLTGARYGEITALKVNDLDPNAGTVRISESKSGKPRNIVLTEEGRRFFDQATIGKDGGDLIFRRTSGGAWGRAHQSRPLHQACEIAKIDPPIGFHILRHTYGSRLAMRGVPMAVIAEQLGHADTRMTERHYAHLGPSYVAETVRAAFDDMGLVPETNVEPMRKKK